MLQTLILDNGAHSIKAGFTTDKTARVFPNTVFKSKTDRKRVYVADELDECTDRSSLFFTLPFERGYLVNWDTQLQIWNRVLGKDCLRVDFQQSKLVLADPNDIALAFSDNTEEIIFENFRFHSFLRTSAPSCTAQSHCSSDNPCCIVVDSGHSFTHIVPFVQGQIVRDGIIRIDIGGKALTNQLKDWISYRQLQVMDETYLINCCKEDCCFVSTDFQRDLDKLSARRVDYILPDFVHSVRGHVQERGTAAAKTQPVKTGQQQTEQNQKLTLAIERFALPELLFHPNDVEINQMGVVEALYESLQKLPKEMQLLMSRNIVLIGGCSLFPGYRDRTEQELRSLMPEQYPLHIHLPSDPICHPWECARAALSADQSAESNLGAKFVQRSEYEEHGPNICRRRFTNFYDGRYDDMLTPSQIVKE